jgi:hypothetical protein
VDCDTGSASASSINIPYDPAFQYQIQGETGYC